MYAKFSNYLFCNSAKRRLLYYYDSKLLFQIGRIYFIGLSSSIYPYIYMIHGEEFYFIQSVTNT